MTDEAERCACGQPLHYPTDAARDHVARLARDYGPTVIVHVAGRGGWHVPRHYIALHGLDSAAVPGLADLYGWARAAR